MAAAFGVHDKLNGVTDAIITGQPINGGTGSFKIITPEVVPPPNIIVKPLIPFVSNVVVRPMKESNVVVKPMKQSTEKEGDFTSRKRKISAPRPLSSIKDKVTERTPREMRVKEFVLRSPDVSDDNNAPKFFFPRSPEVE